MIHKFYPIVPDVDWLKRIVPLGVKTIQLRIKESSNNEIAAQISESLNFCQAYSCQLIVNDYWEEAIACGCDYIHLGQEDLAASDLERIKSHGLKLGISTHSHDELDIALAADPDYVALGPIYETKLKIMKWAPQGLQRLADWKSKINCPLVAIGGITVERAPGVLDAGANSIAVVTDFITHATPEKRIEEWLLAVGDK
ncbi:MAG: thiamine phosphate synthase [Methyloligellaceae bacterium]